MRHLLLRRSTAVRITVMNRSVSHIPHKTSLILVSAMIIGTLPLMTYAPSAGAGETSAMSLTVGFAPDPSWAQVSVAQTIGAYKAEGIEVRIVTFPTGVQTLDALRAGAVDVATSGDFPSAAAIFKDPRIKIVADGS